MAQAIQISLDESDSNEKTLNNTNKIDKYLKEFEKRQKDKEEKEREKVRAAYELVRKDEERQRENEFFDEIVFDYNSASQIHPGLFKIEVHQLRTEC